MNQEQKIDQIKLNIQEQIKYSLSDLNDLDRVKSAALNIALSIDHIKLLKSETSNKHHSWDYVPRKILKHDPTILMKCDGMEVKI